MKAQKDWVILTAVAAVGGLTAAFLFGPKAWRDCPANWAGNARKRSVWLDEYLNEISGRLDALEQQIDETTEDFAQRYEEARRRALASIMPNLDANGNALRLTRSDLDHDLPRMPRG